MAIVNETFARRFFGGPDPIGRRVREVVGPDQPSPEVEIIGVVRDAVYASLRDPVPPTMFQPVAQLEQTPPRISLSARAAHGSPAVFIRSIADAIQRIDRDVAISFRPLSSYIAASIAQERLVAMLSGFFGALALLLAGLGLYGVMAYSVTRRRTEIGVRVALGAAPARVVALVMRRTALLVGLGAVLGGLTAWWAARFAAPLLFGLTPRDPAAFLVAILVLGTVGAVAGWLPARRASRIDPAAVLREG